MTLFERRVIALRDAKRKAKDPEWKDLWELKLKQLIRNEKNEKEARGEFYLLAGE